MNNSREILAFFEYLEKEKQIRREDMIERLTAAIRQAAAKSSTHYGQDWRVEIDPKTCAIKAWAVYKVTDSVADPATQIHIDKARAYLDSPKIGDEYLRKVELDELARIAVKNVYQSLVQNVRHFEKERVYDEYKDSVGDIVTGKVRARERGTLYVDLGKSEGILPRREAIPGEELSTGDSVRCLLLEIESTPRGPEIILSRAADKFITKLFELEVAEIADGSVKIMAIARDAGYRTKIAVASDDPRIDPVGACVGSGGTRVKSIVRELNGEKIDVIKYYEDPQQLLAECIRPAVAKNVQVFPEQRLIKFEVAEGDLSVVIGKRGSNAKLTSRLLGWRLDINKEAAVPEGFNDKINAAAALISQILPNITENQAMVLANQGVNSLEALQEMEASDLAELGFSPAEAEEIVERVKVYGK